MVHHIGCIVQTCMCLVGIEGRGCIVQTCMCSVGIEGRECIVQTCMCLVGIQGRGLICTIGGRLTTSFLKNEIIIIISQNQLMTPSIKSLT
jgi:hypothetical protein